jgi:hypothetical protein
MSLLNTSLLVLLVAGVVFWIARRSRTRPPDPDRVYDPEALDEAEAEVRGLDAFATPEDARDDLPDWGPGAPKP